MDVFMLSVASICLLPVNIANLESIVLGKLHLKDYVHFLWMSLIHCWWIKAMVGWIRLLFAWDHLGHSPILLKLFWILYN